MKFRIKHIDGIGCFSQVKRNFLCPWQKIGKHITGFGLYDKNCNEHPMETLEEATQRVRDYKKWCELEETEPTYWRPV